MRVLAEHLKQHPRHPARMYYAPEDSAEELWDCARHAPAKRWGDGCYKPLPPRRVCVA